MEGSVRLFYLVLALSVLNVFEIGGHVLKRSRRTQDVTKVSELEEMWKREAERMRSYENRLVDPCDDFYEYACGNYENILEDPSGPFNSVIQILTMNLYEKIPQLLSGTFSENSAEQKAKTFYDFCNKFNEKDMVTTIREFKQYFMEKGLLAVYNTDGFPQEYDWLSYVAELQLLGFPALIESAIEKSSKSDEIVLYIDGVDPSDLVFADTIDENSTVAAEFAETVEMSLKLLKMFGLSSVLPDSDAEEVLNFELGRVKIYGDDYHDISLDFVERNYSVFKSQYPGYNWDKYFQTLFGHPIEDSFTVATIDNFFLRPVLEYISAANSKVVAKYLLYYTIKALETTLIALDSRVCGIELSSHMPQVLTSLYVQQFYNQKNREEVKNMVHQLNESTWNLLNSAEWLDMETRRGAQEKLKKAQLLNGYIDGTIDSAWLQKQFENLHFNGTRYIDDVVAMRQHYHRLKLKPNGFLYSIDFFNFNAFYHVSKNIMVVPIGTQLIPAFNYNMPKWFNYGALGSLIAHEFIHAFDSFGRKYDAQGVVRNWWSSTSNKIYTDSTKCFEEKYSTFRYSKNVSAFVDGKATLDENIADNVGIRVAYNAYNNWLANNPNDVEPTLPGSTLTNKQSFFLAYAQIWCEYINPSDYATAVRDDNHSPQKFRVLGSLSNFEEFANQFNCALGTGMNPVQKCRIW